MKRTVKQINYNTTESKVVGIDGVVKIIEHEPVVTGGQWYFDVWFESGDLLRFF